jgi:hypothetical protein
MRFKTTLGKALAAARDYVLEFEPKLVLPTQLSITEHGYLFEANGGDYRLLADEQEIEVDEHGGTFIKSKVSEWGGDDEEHELLLSVTNLRPLRESDLPPEGDTHLADLPHAIAYGNPFDGMTLIGPFENHEAASEHADQFVHEFDWWVVPLKKPETK